MSHLDLGVGESYGVLLASLKRQGQ
jgi:hypothetical protein